MNMADEIGQFMCGYLGCHSLAVVEIMKLIDEVETAINISTCPYIERPFCVKDTAAGI